MADLVSLTIQTGTHASDILIGPGALGRLVDNPFIASADRSVAIINETVDRIYGTAIRERIGETPVLVHGDGELSKDYANAGVFLNELARLSLTRKSLLVAIGGGVTGDFTGFLAALYMRGIPFIQVPTTLLAMVDSSVGGKVAVNLSMGKNMAGAFHQPVQVLADVSLIASLPERELKNGMAEICKHALIGDTATGRILAEGRTDFYDTGLMTRLVHASVSFKAGIVSEDEREAGKRAILNFGHTIGHAIESCTGYSLVTHGEAVAYGMLAAIEISLLRGLLSESDYENAKSLILGQKLAEYPLRFEFDELRRHAAFDKKSEGGEIGFVLLKGVGDPIFGQRVGWDLVKKALGRVAVYTSMEIT